MTREEAIYRLKNTAWLGSNEDREETEQAIDMAIKALSVDGDLISRQSAIDGFYEMACTTDTLCTVGDYVKFLESMTAYQADRPTGWILTHMDVEESLISDIPWEYDGKWIIVTDGKSVSVERFKKDAYDHFYPNGRWFELENVIAWMPLPKPYCCAKMDSAKPAGDSIK